MMMRTFLFALCMTACAASGHGQDWNTDLNTAFEKASSQNKKVFLFFTVPEFCERCESLEKHIFLSKEFQDYAADNFILTRIEFNINPGFSVSAEANAENLLIVEKYNKDGFFPLVVLLNKQHRVLGKLGVYQNETPEKYLQLLRELEYK